MTEPALPQALVLLPFPDAATAENFAAMVISQLPGSASPIVVHGTAYEYLVKDESESDERGQVIEVFPESNFETFVGDRGEGHHVLRRQFAEVADAGTEGSPDHDAGGAGSGEGG